MYDLDDIHDLFKRFFEEGHEIPFEVDREGLKILVPLKSGAVLFIPFTPEEAQNEFTDYRANIANFIIQAVDKHAIYTEDLSSPETIRETLQYKYFKVVWIYKPSEDFTPVKAFSVLGNLKPKLFSFNLSQCTQKEKFDFIDAFLDCNKPHITTIPQLTQLGEAFVTLAIHNPSEEKIEEVNQAEAEGLMGEDFITVKELCEYIKYDKARTDSHSRVKLLKRFLYSLPLAFYVMSDEGSLGELKKEGFEVVDDLKPENSIGMYITNILRDPYLLLVFSTVLSEDKEMTDAEKTYFPSYFEGYIYNQRCLFDVLNDANFFEEVGMVVEQKED